MTEIGFRSTRCREESRHGTHECVRHKEPALAGFHESHEAELQALFHGVDTI
jgi:hypothetical protein